MVNKNKKVLNDLCKNKLKLNFLTLYICSAGCDPNENDFRNAPAAENFEEDLVNRIMIISYLNVNK